MFLTSLLLGRAWCGWVCPAGGLQEAATGVNNGLFKTGKRDWIKWFIMLLRQLVGQMKPVSFAHTPPGAVANYVMLPLALVMLGLSLRHTKTR